MRMIKSTTTVLVVNGAAWNTEAAPYVVGLSFVLWAMYAGLVMIDQMTNLFTQDDSTQEGRDEFAKATQVRAENVAYAFKQMAQPKQELTAVIVKRTTTITDDTPTPGG